MAAYQLQSIRQRGVISTARRYQDRLSPRMSGRLQEVFDVGARVSVAYRGCMVCRQLKEIGVWKEIERSLN